MRQLTASTREPPEAQRIELYLLTVTAIGVAIFGIITRGLAAANPLGFDVFLGLTVVGTGTVCLTIVFYTHQMTRQLKQQGYVAVADVIGTMALAVGAATVFVTISEIITAV